MVINRSSREHARRLSFQVINIRKRSQVSCRIDVSERRLEPAHMPRCATFVNGMWAVRAAAAFDDSVYDSRRLSRLATIDISAMPTKLDGVLSRALSGASTAKAGI